MSEYKKDMVWDNVVKLLTSLKLVGEDKAAFVEDVGSAIKALAQAITHVASQSPDCFESTQARNAQLMGFLTACIEEGIDEAGEE